MSKRLMSDRDHLVALIAGVENLIKDGEIPTTDAVLRLIRTTTRAVQDVYPTSD